MMQVFCARLCVVFGVVIAFALVYHALPYVQPGRPHFAPSLGLLDATYFSLVTQSTVGYGSIVPLSPLAKVVVSMQVGSTLACLIYLSTKAHFQ